MGGGPVGGPCCAAAGGVSVGSCGALCCAGVGGGPVGGPCCAAAGGVSVGSCGALCCAGVGGGPLGGPCCAAAGGVSVGRCGALCCAGVGGGPLGGPCCGGGWWRFGRALSARLCCAGVGGGPLGGPCCAAAGGVSVGRCGALCCAAAGRPFGTAGSPTVVAGPFGRFAPARHRQPEVGGPRTRAAGIGAPGGDCDADSPAGCRGPAGCRASSATDGGLGMAGPAAPALELGGGDRSASGPRGTGASAALAGEDVSKTPAKNARKAAEIALEGRSLGVRRQVPSAEETSTSGPMGVEHRCSHTTRTGEPDLRCRLKRKPDKSSQIANF